MQSGKWVESVSVLFTFPVECLFQVPVISFWQNQHLFNCPVCYFVWPHPPHWCVTYIFQCHLFTTRVQVCTKELADAKVEYKQVACVTVWSSNPNNAYITKRPKTIIENLIRILTTWIILCPGQHWLHPAGCCNLMLHQCGYGSIYGSYIYYLSNV